MIECNSIGCKKRGIIIGHFIGSPIAYCPKHLVYGKEALNLLLKQKNGNGYVTMHLNRRRLECKN